MARYVHEVFVAKFDGLCPIRDVSTIIPIEPTTLSHPMQLNVTINEHNNGHTSRGSIVKRKTNKKDNMRKCERWSWNTKYRQCERQEFCEGQTRFYSLFP